ncbi:MAG: TRAP transporter substrate-binding protein DctP [Methylobacteriaceae bacterium]|nr:TRAP transporter substrate-binding protein DctP [Methylobacteriaceae bacterium]
MKPAFALAAALLAATAFVTSAAAQTEIRISTAAPDVSPLSDAFRQMKARMEAKFKDLKVSVHTASSLFRQGTELPALQRGNLEMASPVTFEIEAQLPEYGAFSAAYLFRDADHLIKTFRSDIGAEFVKDVADKMGIVILDTAYLGTRTVNLRGDKAVAKPTDLSGVKMRMPPGPAFQMLAKALGATAVSMPITEVYLALKTGAIDAQDNPTNMTRDWKFHEVTGQVILTRHLVQPVFIAIARPFFDKLPADQQAELRAAAREAADAQIAKTLKDEKDAVDTFRGAGIKIVEPDIAAFRAAVMEQYRQAGLMEKWKPGLVARIDAVK